MCDWSARLGKPRRNLEGSARLAFPTLLQAPECLGRVVEAQEGLGMFDKSWPRLERLEETREHSGKLREAQGGLGGHVQGARQRLGCPELRHTHSFHIYIYIYICMCYYDL